MKVINFFLFFFSSLNAFKNVWEDTWWNDLIDRVSFSNLIINKLGYVNFYDRNKITELNIKDDTEKNNIIREFIYCWYFDYELLPRDANKTVVMDKLRNFNQIREDENDPLRIFLKVSLKNLTVGSIPIRGKLDGIPASSVTLDFVYSIDWLKCRKL